MLSTIQGVLAHRLLINYRADPQVVTPLLPPGLRPQLVDGCAVVGVCALRLTRLRPAHVPAALGITSDNAAHRVAVVWDSPAGVTPGVWITRRDSAQRVAVLAGGRLFPGVHGPARFTVERTPDRLRLALVTGDGLTVDAVASPLTAWSSRLFPTPEAASAFFAAGRVGWSAGHHGGTEGLALDTPDWRADPVDLQARSAFFDEVLPAGSCELDHGLLLRDLPVTWADPGGQRPAFRRP